MTTFILFFVLAGICSFGFHLFFGRTLESLPFYLIAGFGGAVVGYVVAMLLKLDWWVIGGVPVLLTAAGAFLFLTLVRRMQF